LTWQTDHPPQTANDPKGIPSTCPGSTQTEGLDVKNAMAMIRQR
jgi:hypothetical protein